MVLAASGAGGWLCWLFLGNFLGLVLSLLLFISSKLFNWFIYREWKWLVSSFIPGLDFSNPFPRAVDPSLWALIRVLTSSLVMKKAVLDAPLYLEEREATSGSSKRKVWDQDDDDTAPKGHKKPKL